MAIAVGQVDSGAATFATSHSFNHNPGADANNCTVFLVGITDSSAVGTVTNCTIDGNSDTQVDQQAVAGFYAAYQGYYLGQGSGSVQCTATCSSEHNDIAFGVITLTGAHQTTPIGTAVKNSGSATTATCNNIVSSSDEICVYVINAAWATVGENDTTQQFELGPGNQDTVTEGSTQTGATDTDASWTLSGAGYNDGWAVVGCPYKPAAGAASWPHGPLGHPLQGALGGPV